VSTSTLTSSPQEWAALYRRDDGEQQPISPVEREFGVEAAGRRHGLEIIRSLVTALGDPQLRFPTIHVAGSKGKGSTVAMLSLILRAAGYRVGSYTSPSLTHFGERIQVNGESISDAQTERHLDRIQPFADRLAERPKFFEVTTAIAFEHFAQQAVDVAVIEVGIGGRLDATNVVMPELAIITSLELEHTYILGDTIEAIAREKAGIIKPGVATLTAVTDAEAIEAIADTCDERGSRLWRIDRDFAVRKIRGDTKHQRIDVELGPELGGVRFADLDVGLAGDAQTTNAALAVAAARLVRPRFSRVTDSAVRQGLRDARWPGRLELVDGRPAVLLDVAHTPASACQMRRYVDRFFGDVPKTLVIGMLRDKRVHEVTAQLAGAFDQIIAAPVKWFRTLEADPLAAAFLSHGESPRSAPTIASAVELAIQSTPPHGLVVIAGSLFAVGEAKRRFGW